MAFVNVSPYHSAPQRIPKFLAHVVLSSIDEDITLTLNTGMNFLMHFLTQVWMEGEMSLGTNKRKSSCFDLSLCKGCPNLILSYIQTSKWYEGAIEQYVKQNYK